MHSTFGIFAALKSRSFPCFAQCRASCCLKSRRAFHGQRRGLWTTIGEGGALASQTPWSAPGALVLAVITGGAAYVYGLSRGPSPDRLESNDLKRSKASPKYATAEQMQAVGVLAIVSADILSYPGC